MDLLPPYLASPVWPENTNYLANISLSGDGRRWLLSGDPQVTLVAKRLFPGSRSHGPGGMSFPNNVRVLQDLVWFMQRYPISADAEHAKSLSEAIQSAQSHAVRRIELDKKRDAPVGVAFKGIARPYQVEALAFMLGNPKTLIADDMGLGKTVEAIMLLASGAGFPALVVPQPHLVTQWQGMLDNFLVSEHSGLKVAVVRGRGVSKDDIKRGKDVLPDADIIIMHYGLVSWWKDRLLGRGIKTVVFDEVQELRHQSTDKYSACSLISSSADHVIGLSGTPVYNYGEEMWSVMNAIDFHCLGPRDDFLREWCTVQNARHLVSDPAALGAYLRREGLMLRRRKTDVANQLPPKHRAVEVIDADDSVFRSKMQSALPMLEKYGTADRFTRFTLAGRIGEEARRATGLAKIDAAVTFIGTLLEAGEPVVVFAHHHDVVDALMEGLAPWSVVAHTGRETSSQKDEAKAAFINGEANAIIISLRATTGIDGLQKRARIAVFCELDWSPAIHAQAEDRLWRDGQALFVMAYYLVCSVGSDPDMQAKLGLKIGQSKGILDDPFETEEDRIQDQEITKSFVSTLVDKLAKQFGTAKSGSVSLSVTELAS